MEASFVGTKKPQVLSKPGLVCEQTTFRSSLETKKKNKLCLYLQNYRSLGDSNLTFKAWGSPLDDEN